MFLGIKNLAVANESVRRVCKKWRVFENIIFPKMQSCFL